MTKQHRKWMDERRISWEYISHTLLICPYALWSHKISAYIHKNSQDSKTFQKVRALSRCFIVINSRFCGRKRWIKCYCTSNQVFFSDIYFNNSHHPSPTIRFPTVHKLIKNMHLCIRSVQMRSLVRRFSGADIKGNPYFSFHNWIGNIFHLIYFLTFTSEHTWDSCGSLGFKN